MFRNKSVTDDARQHRHDWCVQTLSRTGWDPDCRNPPFLAVYAGGMAASFPRPDPSSPASIAEANFNTSRRGYSTDEVKAFLKAVSVELQRLQERERQLQGELALAKSQEPQVADLDDEAMTRIVGDETVRVLQTARESASLDSRSGGRECRRAS